MGAWGTGSFENDDASDWVDELAAAHGKAAADLPKEVTAWEDAHGNAVSGDLLDLARRAVREVAGGGELRELWDEADDPGWSASVRDLDSRLG